MAPRKSDASKGAGTDEGTPVKEREGVNVEDLGLPRTIVQRLAKGVLPPNTQIQRDAVLAISKSATVFVSYLSATANENAQRSNKKTIMPKDVLDAISEIEFEDFLPRLEAELAKYNEIQLAKRDISRKKAAEKVAAAGNISPNGAATNGTHEGDADSPPAAKKARRSSGGGTGKGTANEGLAEASGDETISEGNGEDGAEEEPSEEDDAEEVSGEEEVEEEGDALDTQDPAPPDDEALDNGEDSD